MTKSIFEIDGELMLMERQREQVDKALSGRKALAEEEVIQRQSEKWAAAWRKERRR